MITRRQFGLGVGTSVMCGVGAAAASTTDVTFTAYALPTEWHPISKLHNWPLDHTCIATSSGMEWGCFGRKYSEDPSVATVLEAGPGDDLWAKEIAGEDGYAGIDYGVTGVCDQCSNRILLPASLTVKNSPGNEIAILLCGIYGLKLKDFALRVESAAAAVNKRFPGRIPDHKVEAAVAMLGRDLESEWDLVRSNNERLIKPVLGDQYDAIAPDIEDVYLSFYYRREALIHAWERGAVDKGVLVRKVSIGFLEALNDLRDVVGVENYRKIVPIPPKDATEYVFYRERA